MTLERATAGVEIMRDAAGLDAIADEWRGLAVARGNPFVTPEWFLAWHGRYGGDSEPLVVAVRDPSGLRGVVPLVAQRSRPHAWRFAGANLGDHFHPAAGSGDEAAVAAAAAGALSAAGHRSPLLVLDNVDVSARWWGELARGVASHPALIRDRPAVLPRARIAGRGWDEYLASLSRNLRSQLGRRRRRLESGHDVGLRWTRDEAEVVTDLETMFRLHDARFATRRLGSSLTSEVARAFHVDFALAAHRRGWLRLCFLEVDGEPAAGWYGWRLGERFSYYQAGFDPRFGEHSVGLLLFAATIEAAIEEGAAEYDMLLGDEPFKARFADSARSVHTVVATARLRPRRFAIEAEVGLRRLGRRLPERLRSPAQAVASRLTLARKR